MHQLDKIFQQVNVPCKDNGCEFLVSDKLDAVAHLLANSRYSLKYSGALSRIYSSADYDGSPIVLISVHVDDVYNTYFLRDLGQGLWQGTFDNSLSAACVLHEMLGEHLPANVWVALTGDEEVHSNGAKEVCEILTADGINIAQVVVTEVTHAGWEDQCAFVVENDRNMSLGKGWEMLGLLSEHRFAYLHEAEPDESEIYAGAGLSVLTLSIPVEGDMHSDEGCCVRHELLPTYCEVLRNLVNLFAEIAEEE
jgi:hypothetical protein